MNLRNYSVGRGYNKKSSKIFRQHSSVPLIRPFDSSNKRNKSGIVLRKRSRNRDVSIKIIQAIRRKSRTRLAMHDDDDDYHNEDGYDYNYESEDDDDYNHDDSDDEYLEHITFKFDGLDEECGPVYEICVLCNKDLIYLPCDDSAYNEEYEDELELPKLPEVAVLACGHSFHSECFCPYISDEHSRDPECFLCFSYCRP